MFLALKTNNQTTEERRLAVLLTIILMKSSNDNNNNMNVVHSYPAIDFDLRDVSKAGCAVTVHCNSLALAIGLVALASHLVHHNLLVGYVPNQLPYFIVNAKNVTV